MEVRAPFIKHFHHDFIEGRQPEKIVSCAGVAEEIHDCEEGSTDGLTNTILDRDETWRLLNNDVDLMNEIFETGDLPTNRS